MKRYYYGDAVCAFLAKDPGTILGVLSANHEYALEPTQRDAWLTQIELLQNTLVPYRESGHIYFEFSIPRLGRRIDVVLVLESVIFVLEFKVNANDFSSSAVDQVVDYALDLKNFHETSHALPIAPVLIATDAEPAVFPTEVTAHPDKTLLPIKTNRSGLSHAIEKILTGVGGDSVVPAQWEAGRYCPTPTIIEAATSLYSGHAVAEISRTDASAVNLTLTSEAISNIIHDARAKSIKAICFVTGVPGAGKTLIGLNIATKHIDKTNELYSVFLSGNGPLVDILREALARDKVRREKRHGRKAKKYEVLSEVKLFIQNVHHFRDDCLIDTGSPPIEHVALFDEAQRAWNKQQTAAFMHRKKKVPNFDKSEPEFLISCLDRHRDWAVVVCLVGGGQEINTGEAGISEWIESLMRSFPHWQIYISSRLTDTEYAAGQALEQLGRRPNVDFRDELHLGVSMRSFRAENVSLLVKQILDLEPSQARQTLQQIDKRYPHAQSESSKGLGAQPGPRDRAVRYRGLVAGAAPQAICH
jgi:hypothetical protein